MDRVRNEIGSEKVVSENKNVIEMVGHMESGCGNDDEVKVPN